MKKIEDFIESMVTIDIQDGAYGHYPFQLMSVNAEGKLTCGALFLGGNVEAVYRAAKKIYKEGSVRLWLSVDFPAGPGIDTDFVAVYELAQERLDCVAIPYDPETGERFPLVNVAKVLDMIKQQFCHILNS